jgi:hypothetical protein
MNSSRQDLNTYPCPPRLDLCYGIFFTSWQVASIDLTGTNPSMMCPNWCQQCLQTPLRAITVTQPSSYGMKRDAENCAYLAEGSSSVSHRARYPEATLQARFRWRRSMTPSGTICRESCHFQLPCVWRLRSRLQRRLKSADHVWRESCERNGIH